MESGFKAISHVVFDLKQISPVELDFKALQGSIFEWILSDFEVHFGGIWVGGCVFLVWFWHGFCCKGSAKDALPLHAKVQKSRTTFHNVCLFACCQLGLSIILESVAELSGPC